MPRLLGNQTVWTEKEQTCLTNALREHGKNYGRIMEVIGDKSLRQVKLHLKKLRKEIEEHPEHKNADLLPVIKQRKEPLGAAGLSPIDVNAALRKLERDVNEA